MRLQTIVSVTLVCLFAAGCDHMSQQQQRALSGGAIGAAGGAAIGALAGGAIVTGAVIGAAGGAAVGALTHDSKR